MRMRRWSRMLLGMVLGGLMLVGGRSWADSALSWIFHSGATATGNGNELPAEYFSTIVVQIEGTFVGTVTFEKKTKDATGWVSVLCREATQDLREVQAGEPGYWECPGGAYRFRARVSSYTSGTIIVTGIGTTAVASRGSGVGAQGLDDVILIDRIYGGAVSQGTAPKIGSTASGRFWSLFDDPTNGLKFTCEISGVLDNCDKGHDVKATYKSYVADASGNRLTNFEPNASTAKEQYALGTKKIRKYLFIPAGYFVGDGTNCPLAASAVTINSGPKTLTMVCGSSANGDMDFDLVMDAAWDGGTLTFESVYTQTAANTSAMHSDIKAQCRGNGETPSSTWGTAVAIDDAAVTGSSATDRTTSAAVTPAGTCAAGDQLFVRYTLDVTGTTTPEATLHFYGIGMFYHITSLSS